jgi:hypothetical protein
MNRCLTSPVTLAICFLCVCALAPAQTSSQSSGSPSAKLLRITGENTAELSIAGKAVTLPRGEHAGPWTLVEILTSPSHQQVILEDFTQLNGHMLFLDSTGVVLDLPKSSESTAADPARLYLGHTKDEITSSPQDLLAREILAKPGDPSYDDIAALFPPIQKMPTYSFVGTPQTFDKVGFVYGGRSPNFDPAPYDPAIIAIRDHGKVLDGLLGGYLPVLRFVYPESETAWTEMLAFAPFRVSENNDRVQPVWYRLVHIENGVLQWSKYIDSYHPFPPRTDYDPKIFYRDLLALHHGWNRELQLSMTVEIPDLRVANLARFSLIRERMTRIHDFPKYGAVDKDYAGSEHDGFPDTFTADTAAMLDWGLTDIAGRYIDNFFGKFVRDDGSLLYRGPETGQYGRMLTVLAQFIDFGGDPQILLAHRRRIDGVTRLLLNLRALAKKLPASDPAYGMLAGWSEADASLDPQPQRYMQPYFSNSTEAARGFRDLGRAWEKIGKQKNNAELIAWGRRLQREAAELRKDLDTSLSRSMLTLDGEKILPSIAGANEPFHVVVPRDAADPQYRSYRAYMEMLHSGSLTADQVQTIVAYRANHHDTILGVPTAYGYNTGDLVGFLSYGHGYGLIQHDKIREAILLLYSLIAHQYTRGTWLAPETRNPFLDTPAAPYCTPAQLAAAMITRWLLVFEDPESETLWLGKGLPQDWLADGKTVSVKSAPTRWGRVSYSITSQIQQGMVNAEVTLPQNFNAATKLRLRVPGAPKISSVSLNSKPWTHFDAAEQTITLPPGRSGTLRIAVQFH